MLVAVLGLLLVLGALPAAANVEDDAPKVAIIVGPVGEQLTPLYIELAERAADAAFEGGAKVERAYSPDATPERVLEAVEDANIVVYFGHGTGLPKGLTSSFDPEVANGWGLQGPRARGTHDDSLSRGTLKYYGESWIARYARPAPGFVMIYSNACYATGTPDGTLASVPSEEAAQRAGYYSRGMLEMGASAYFATDFYAGAATLVSAILASPTTTYGDIFRADPHFATGALEADRHPFVEGRELWLHKSAYFFGEVNYWYAFAGDPEATPAGSGVNTRTIDFAPERTIRFRGGEHTGYQFGPDGEVVDTKTAWLGRDSAAPAAQRTRIPGQDGYWFQITEGVWAGYYVQESAKIHLPGIGLQTTLDPERPVDFEPGRHVGYRFTRDGTVADARAEELEDVEKAEAEARAVINGERYLLISDGEFEGYWVKESEAVQLRPLPAPVFEPAPVLASVSEWLASLPGGAAAALVPALPAPGAADAVTPGAPAAGGGAAPGDGGSPAPPPEGGGGEPAPSPEPSPSPTPLVPLPVPTLPNTQELLQAP